jgi:hypothetical protein
MAQPHKTMAPFSGPGGGALGRVTLLAGVQVFALVVFMLGFFLTRQEVPHHSHCQVRPCLVGTVWVDRLVLPFGRSIQVK